MRTFRMCIIGIGIEGDSESPVLLGGLFFHKKQADTHDGNRCETNQRRHDHPVLEMPWDFFDVLNSY